MLEANTLGVSRWAACPTVDPVCQVKKAGKSYREMKSGMRALLIAGSIPDPDFKADFIIVQASHATPLPKKPTSCSHDLPV